MKLRDPNNIVLDALRAEVKELITHCTEKQAAFFSRIYPHGIDKMTEHELRNSVGLIGRTIRLNVTGDIFGKMPEPAPN